MRYITQHRWKFSAFLIALAVAITVAMLSHVRPNIVATDGGSYVGELPVLGRVQLDLFISDDWANGWVYREKEGAPQVIDFTTNTRTSFRGIIRDIHCNETNANVEFDFTKDSRTIEGLIGEGTNKPDRKFVLSRAFQYAAIKQHSGVRLGRFGANTTYNGKFPLIDSNSVFGRALNETIATLVDGEARRFTTGNLERRWEVLRNGDSVWPGTSTPQWQIRYLSDSIASFAVWDEPYFGGCGDFTKWSGRNFAWRSGKLHQLKLADLFRDDSGWDEEIRTFCREELRREGFAGSASSLNTETPLEIFTLSSTGLQIYFNPYEIGGGGDGEFIIHIPYERLRKYYKLGWLASLLPTAPKLKRGEPRDLAHAAWAKLVNLV